MQVKTLKWAGRCDHLNGFPRKVVIAVVSAFAKIVTNVLNSTKVHNSKTLVRLVRSRPKDQPLITVSNHMSTLDDPLMWGFDDPLMWGFKGFPSGDAKLARWVLAAEDPCFKNIMSSYLFRLVDAPIRRLKWGTASLIARSLVTPIVLPIVHCGFEKVMPENSFFGRRPPFPLCNRDIKITIGEPIHFDLQNLKQKAMTLSEETQSQSFGWPLLSPDGLSEVQQRWLYANISDCIRTAMERLRCLNFALGK